MKRFGSLVLVVCALMAGFAGSVLHHNYVVEDARDVEAQLDRRDKSVRIALVNLEECARQSGAFKQLKIKWDETQEDVTRRSEKMKREYETKGAQLRRARRDGRTEDETLGLRVELKSLEEQMEVAEKEQRAYLSQILNQYQKSVLEVVMASIEEYAKVQKFDIVLQDYSVDSGEAAFFEGSAYAQALLTKPVLYAPGVVDNSNGYVVDITPVMVERLRNVRLPRD